MMYAAIILASLLGAAPITWVILRYQLDLAKVDALRDGAEFDRGFEAGMRRAASILDAHPQFKQYSGRELASHVLAAVDPKRLRS